MDMLSNLPEEILCHILSFLPTRTSAACSVLSKRWKLLWTLVPVVDFDLGLRRGFIGRNKQKQEKRFIGRNKQKQEKKEKELEIVAKFYLLPREFPGLRLYVLVDEFDYSCLNELPVFHNLVSLEISIPSCDFVLLPHLLQKFPNLTHLTIEKLFGIEEAEVYWKEPQQVPICLSSTLSTFCFQRFEGYRVEVELVKYVKRHAKVLKNMIIETSTYFKELQARVEAIQKLPMVVVRSEKCQFHIH